MYIRRDNSLAAMHGLYLREERAMTDLPGYWDKEERCLNKRVPMVFVALDL